MEGGFVSRSDKPTGEVLERRAATERLVDLAGADWGITAVQVALPSIRRAQTSNERNRLINQLARSMVTEARQQYRDDLVLFDVWLGAAIEAASACLEVGVDEDAA